MIEAVEDHKVVPHKPMAPLLSDNGEEPIHKALEHHRVPMLHTDLALLDSHMVDQVLDTPPSLCSNTSDSLAYDDCSPACDVSSLSSYVCADVWLLPHNCASDQHTDCEVVHITD